MRVRPLLVALACAIAPAITSAEPAGSGLDDYSVTTWGEPDGLPAAGIRALAQGADGDLWLGTQAGLVRFDGLRFVPFERLQKGRLPSDNIGALLPARDGSLWVGLNGRTSIARVDRAGMQTFGEADGLPEGQISSLHQDRSGAIWAGSTAGLFRLDDRRWTRVALPDEGATSVLAIGEDAAGRLWAAGRFMVFHQTGTDRTFEVVERLGPVSSAWQSLSMDRDGRMWISDFEHGVRPLGEASHARPRPDWRAWGVQVLHDSRGTMWVATRGQGLWRVSSRGPDLVPTVITLRDGLVNDSVQSVLEDRDGNIWVGTQTGLQRLARHRVTPRRDLGVVRALEATSDGAVWVGTSEGLSRITPSGRRLFTAADGLPGTVVQMLYGDRAGALWVATERGFARYAGGRFTPFTIDPQMERVAAMTSPRPGDLWLRDFAYRIYHWRDGATVPVTELPESFRRNVFSLHSDRAGNVWIGGPGRIGVRRADGSFRAYELPIGAVSPIREDRAGAIWAGGSEGLSRITDAGVESLTRAHGFPGSVKGMVEDGAGDMWVAIASGLIRIANGEFSRAAAVAGRGFHYRFLNAADGMAGVPLAEGAKTCVRAADGTLWFSTSGGVTLVDPSRVDEAHALPPLRIESVSADGQRFVPETRRFEPSHASHVHIAYNALAMSDATRVRFRYRLENYDRDWIDGGASREASYINLPPGDYRFVVEASNGDGVWSSRADYHFGIAPMFYQARWFYALCAIAVGGVVAGAWRLRVSQVRRQFALVLAERIRMSREIHDTLLQGLVGLALEIDDLSHHLDGARPSARDRVVAMRRRVEGYLREARLSIRDMRTPHVASQDFSQALRDVAQRAIGDRPVRLDLTVNGVPQRCPPRVKEQLLLIGQEAVNNAVRHGQPTRVGFELDCDEHRTRLRISDDGRGFDADDALRIVGHYGLRGMRERAEQVRGTISIDSAPGRGTRVEATVPI